LAENLNEEKIREKIEKGWIKSRMWFEAMAIDKQVTEQALKDHIGKISKAEGSIVLSERYEQSEEVEKPMKNIEKAFTQAVEIELLTQNIETLLFDVIFFAPSSVEVMEPKELKINLTTMQAIMNTVADVMHRLVAAGSGGIVIPTKK
jgi:hypothetical protein